MALVLGGCGPGDMEGSWELRRPGSNAVLGRLRIEQVDRGAPLAPDELSIRAELRGQTLRLEGGSYGAGFETFGRGCRTAVGECADSVLYYLGGWVGHGRISNRFDGELRVHPADTRNPFDPAGALEREAFTARRVQ